MAQLEKIFYDELGNQVQSQETLFDSLQVFLSLRVPFGERVFLEFDAPGQKF